jgi:membrane-associated phospholipid phosphatase
VRCVVCCVLCGVVVVRAGAAHGTATPSSHCAVTVALWLLSMHPRLGSRRLAVALAFCVPGLVVATVYLQYHYGFDALVGTLMGIVLAPLCVALTTLLARLCRLKRLPSVDLSRTIG